MEQKKRCAACGYENRMDVKFCLRCGNMKFQPPQRLCPACGRPVDDKGSFCHHCGARLTAPPPPPPPPVKQCRRCGIMMDARYVVCPRCGYSETATPPPRPQPRPQPKKKASTWWVWLLVGLFVLGLVGNLGESLVEMFQPYEYPDYTVGTYPQLNSRPTRPTLPDLYPDPTTQPATQPTQPVAKPTQPATKPTQPVVKPTQPTVKPTEPYNPVPSELRSNVYLVAKGDGDCETLTGDVMITVIFVSDPNYSWNSTAIQDAKATFSQEVKTLEADAKRFGAELDVEITYYNATISVNHDKDSRDWEKAALKQLGMEYVFTDQERLEEHYGVDEAPVVFVLNQKGRSYATIGSSNRSFERAVLYSDGLYALRHELYHNFGARDFYYPDETEELADRYLPNSIMVDSEEGVTDDLTAFVIGWLDELTPQAEQFLRETNWITESYLSEAKKENTLTGYGTQVYDNGTYTGYLVDGVRHGKGTYTWDNGNVYVGDWEHGERTGNGEFYWADGAYYTGQWVEGDRVGYGEMTYADGGVYKGNWKDDVRHGKGTLIYVGGNKYTGDWKDGNRHGEGTFTWKSGDKYVGEWVDDVRTGYGIYYWPDGSRHEGYWKNNNRHGKGTHYYADGSTKTGTWKDDKYVG